MSRKRIALSATTAASFTARIAIIKDGQRDAAATTSGTH
jgi:hypothetical protein